LKFWAGAEVFQPAYASLSKCRNLVQLHLNEALSQSGLASFDAEVRYVPIVMPIGMRERYPARSKLHRKDKAFDCSPQLDYNIFITGTFEEQLREYVEAVSNEAGALKGLGASDEQVDSFRSIIAVITDRILLEETRH
jgi:hypothetical protein